MIGYYLELALEGLRRNRILTLLVIVAIGLGIGASMTMITVIHVMTGDPIPGQSHTIFFPHLKPGPKAFERASGADTGDSFTWLDANNLLRDRKADRQAMMVGARAAVRSPNGQTKAFYARGRYASSEFFSLFSVPFAQGAGWDAQADQDRAREIVLNQGLADRLYGTGSVVGKTLMVEGRDFRVIGVVKNWRPKPLFYGSAKGDSAFKIEDEFFLPINTAMDLEMPIAGGMTCWASGPAARTGDGCAWLQYWVKLSSPARVSEYQNYLNAYWQQQTATNRSINPAPATLEPLLERIKLLNLIPGEVKLQLWLAVGFLCVCILNAVGLLLAKFLARGDEVSIRRAMGATQKEIISQFIVEAAVTGLAGGLLGIFFTIVGLFAVRQRPDGYAQIAQLDMPMLLLTIVLAIVATLLAGLLPAWRAGRIEPALQLKVQ